MRKIQSILQLLTKNELLLLNEQSPKSKTSKIVVAMSGGVDSSLTCKLLLENGYSNVIGCWMRNWDISDNDDEMVNDGPTCSQIKDLEDAQHVADSLGIELIQKDFSRDYWNSVWDPCLKKFENGVTPNPDWLCNREIKFGSFFQEIMKESNVDYIATGHYAQINNDGKLKRGLDPLKDQSYFLSAIPPSILKHVCFPIGGLTKKRIKQLATEAGFGKISKKEESMGVCFIGEKRSFSSFLEEYLVNKKGRFKSVIDGSDLGPHKGILAYTVGQRACISGAKIPYYVARKEINNDVLVCPGNKHEALKAVAAIIRMDKKLFLENDLKSYQELTKDELLCQIRYQSIPQKCTIEIMNENEQDNSVLLKTTFVNGEYGVSEGQILAIYFKDICLGSGEILQVKRPYFENNEFNTMKHIV